MSIFAKIIAKEIPADIVHETDEVIAFRDISPKAPTHILVIPKKPIARMNDATSQDANLLGNLLLAAAEIARKLGLDRSGYRLVINNGKDGGESVPHLHVHLLGGRSLTWPPG
jgi:histidine triad (HIT) family protein